MATAVIKHLDHLNLSVTNFEQTREWYARVFGFELVEHGLSMGVPWGVLRRGDAMLCIYEHPQRTLPSKQERQSGHLHGISHFGLRITDRVAWEDVAQRHALELYYDSPVRYPHSTSWYVRDPTGYEIEIALWDDDTTRFD